MRQHWLNIGVWWIAQRRFHGLFQSSIICPLGCQSVFLMFHHEIAWCLCLWSKCLQLISCWVEVPTRVVLITMAHQVSDACILCLWHKLSRSQSMGIPLFTAMQSRCHSIPLLSVVVRKVLFLFWQLADSRLLAAHGQTALKLLFALISMRRYSFNAFVGNQDRLWFTSWRVSVVVTPSCRLFTWPEINCLVEKVGCLEFQFS